jgi:hypothetical protein
MVRMVRLHGPLARTYPEATGIAPKAGPTSKDEVGATRHAAERVKKKDLDMRYGVIVLYNTVVAQGAAELGSAGDEGSESGTPAFRPAMKFFGGITGGCRNQGE